MMSGKLAKGSVSQSHALRDSLAVRDDDEHVCEGVTVRREKLAKQGQQVDVSESVRVRVRE